MGDEENSALDEVSYRRCAVQSLTDHFGSD